MRVDNLSPKGQLRPMWVRLFNSKKGFLRICRDAGAAGGQGGGSGDGGAGAGAGAGAAGAGAGAGDWKSGLTPELKGNPTFEKFKDVNGLATGYLEIQKVMGLDKVHIPKDDSPKDVWDSFFAKLGRPGEVNGYKLSEIENRPAELPVNEKEIEAFKKAGHDLGLTNKQLDGVYKFYMENLIGSYNTQVQSKAEGLQKAETGLRREWGAAYDQNIQFAKRVMKQFADADTVKLLDEGLGNDPRVLRLFANVGKKFSESNIEIGAGQQGFALSPEQAQAEINKIKGDTKHPYWVGNHPEHQAAVERMNDLYKMVATGAAGVR